MEKPTTQPEVRPDHTQDAATLPPQAKPPTESATLPPSPNQQQLRTQSHVNGASPPTEPVSAQSVPIDIVIPGYEILGELGRGGMGVVYKARHLKLGRLVALKMILAGGHAGEADLARFRTEAEAIARVKHANIIQIYEIGEHEGKPYFSLEFCVGGSLAQKIAGTPMLPKDAARLVEKLARGMEAAHQEDIIHRDLKPANVLLASDGTPKITDFGLAKKLDDAGQTQSGAIMGTPSYMAPEQAGGKNKDLGPACDVYALGAILYELLTGRPPFKAATPLDTVMQVMMNEPVSPSQLQNKTPRDLDTICLKCLQKDARKRYASAKALADDLRRYQKGEPIHARPVGNVERAVKWVKRRPMVAGLIAAVVLVAVVGCTGVSGGLGWALVERENAIDQEKKTAKALEETEEARKQSDEDRQKAEKLGEHNKQLAEKETKARLEADEGRAKAEDLALRVQFEHYLSKADDRPDLALVGMANLLPKAALLKDPSIEEYLRLQIGAWSGHAARLNVFQVASPRVALSADGKIAVTGNIDNTARVWETATGKPIGAPLQHQGAVLAVALSADGRTALTGSIDKTARLWDTTTGKPTGPPLQHQGWVRAAALSADGKTALTGSDDKTARLWDATTGKPLGPPLQHKGGLRAVALSADGKTALTGSEDMTARLWDAATSKPIGPPLPHQTIVCAVAVSADGKTALTGSYDGTARLWEAATGKPIGAPLQHQSDVLAVALSADGKTALTGGRDNTARLWQAASGTPIGPPLQNLAWVEAVALSADGKTALTGSLDKTARLWETATGKPIGPPLQHQDGVVAVALSADGKTALTGGWDKTARLWETAAGKPQRPPLQHQQSVVAVVLSADGKTALTGNADKTARLWDTATGKPIGPSLWHRDSVFAVALSADGKTALTGSADKTARLWETATGKPTGPPLQHKDGLRSVALSARRQDGS